MSQWDGGEKCSESKFVSRCKLLYLSAEFTYSSEFNTARVRSAFGIA